MNTLAIRDIAERFNTHALKTPGDAVLFIDGHSGSGKTALAMQLANEVSARQQGGSAPQILGMDELYPGWRGLAAGSAALTAVLETLSYRRYDWHRHEFGETRALEPSRTLIVEGCGSISGPALAAATAHWGPAYAVWIVAPRDLRRSRALTRDGEMFAPHWDEWAAQEQDLFAHTTPWARAHEIVHVG